MRVRLVRHGSARLESTQRPASAQPRTRAVTRGRPWITSVRMTRGDDVAVAGRARGSTRTPASSVGTRRRRIVAHYSRAEGAPSPCHVAAEDGDSDRLFRWPHALLLAEPWLLWRWPWEFDPSTRGACVIRGDGRARLFHQTRLGPRVRQVKRSLKQSLKLRHARHVRHCRALR